MYGKYHDVRVYQHLVHTYSRVPYLDHEIFNIQSQSLRESRRASQRAQTAQKGLDRTKEKSELLENIIKETRNKKEEEAKDYLASLQRSQESCLQKQKEAWSQFTKQQEQRIMSHTKDQLYLQNMLKTNATRAQSRLTSVRRWA